MIREFEEKDLSLYLELTKQFYASDAVLNPVPEEYRKGTFAEMLKSDRYVDGYLIEKEGETAGFALLAKTYSQECGGIVIWLEELYILEEFRGQGLGKEFFAFMFEKYKSAKRFRLEVVEDHEDVIRLYKNMGFEKFAYMQMILEKNQPM